jgi:hypothetical protein
LATIAASALVGCTGSPDEITATTDTDSHQFGLEATEIVNRYARAIYEKDPGTLTNMFSSELREAMLQPNAGLDLFIEKQRRMMTTTFQNMESGGMGSRFELVRVAAQEGAIAVTVKRDGVELPRPFYFVLEGNSYRLNVARKGFSQGLPEGAAANDNYKVDNRGSTFVQASCLGGGGVSVPPYSSTKVSCPNACGRWFSGAWFDGTAWVGQTHYCDYNTWGADVIYSTTFPTYGMACAGPC